MTEECLILHDRASIPEDLLSGLMPLLGTVTFQEIGKGNDLTSVLKANTGATLLVSPYMDLSASNLSHLTRLRAIVASTTAVEYIDLEYCRTNAIRVMNNPGYAAASVAEYAIALMLYVARGTPSGNGLTTTSVLPAKTGIELAGTTAGIVGLGDIGSRIATSAHGLGMEAIFVNRSAKSHPHARQTTLDELVRVSDFVFVAVPLNKSTHNLLDRDHISQMKREAILISTSPSGVLDLAALDEGLRSGRPKGAALDLVDDIVDLHNTPHLITTVRHATNTAACARRRVEGWRDTLHHYLRGQPRNQVV